MRFHRPFSAALLAVAVTLAARSAATQPVAVSFAESAASLPQDDIRAAVARELEHRPVDSDAVSGTLDIAIENEHLVARFSSAQGTIERRLPLPDDRTQIPVMLGLLAGNLARDQRAAVRPEPAAPVTAPERAPVAVPPPAPRFRRHHLGLHIAQDFVGVSSGGTCGQNARARRFDCFYAGTEDPFMHSADPNSDSAPGELSVSTTRVLVSYDYALLPSLGIGLRAGYAFGEGPPTGKQTNPDGSLEYEGSAIFPGHLEVRATYWVAPLTTRPTWNGFFGAGFGIGLFRAKVPHAVADCQALTGTDQGPAFDNCYYGKNMPPMPPTTKLDAWFAAGGLFVSVRGGAMLSLSDAVAATLDVSAMYAFPDTAPVLEPSLGMLLTP